MSSDKAIPERCADCPVAKAITGEAFDRLVSECLGPKVIQLTCETIKVCGSPYKRNNVLFTAD